MKFILETTDNTERPPYRPIRVLIVDDDRAIADILQEYLARDGERQVDACYDGLAAVQRLQAETYDLVIVDMVMPGMGGLDVLRCAKAANPDAVVIIITGYATLENAITAVKEGAYDYIRKPFKLEEINIAVDKAVEKITVNKENRLLQQKLKDAYAELVNLKKERAQQVSEPGIDLPPSNIPLWQHLDDPVLPVNDYVEKLQAISALKQSGVLTESEFNEFKKHLLKLVTLDG